MNASPYAHFTAEDQGNRQKAARLLEDSALPEKVASPHPVDELFSIAVINEDLEDIFMNSLLSEWDTDDGYGPFEGHAFSLEDQYNSSPLVDCTEMGDPLCDDIFTGSFSFPLSSTDSIVTIDSNKSPSHASQLSQEMQQLQRLSESMRRSEITRAQVILHREAMISQLRQCSDEQTLQNFPIAMQQGQDNQALQDMTDWLSAQITNLSRA
jgi:hypothetical protein